MPAFSVFTALPACFSEIVKPGPTVPISFGCAIEDDVPAASSPTAAAATSVHMSFMSGRYARSGRSDYVTLKLPFIDVKCGSQTYV